MFPLFHLLLMGVATFGMMITSYLKRHPLLAGASIGLLVGVSVEVIYAMPVFSNNNSIVSSLLSFGTLVPCSGMAVLVWVKGMRRFDANTSREAVSVPILLMSGLWTGAFAGAGVLAMLGGWKAAMLCLSQCTLLSAALLLLVAILSLLPALSWPSELLQVLVDDKDRLCDYLDEKLMRTRVWRWLFSESEDEDALSRG